MDFVAKLLFTQQAFHLQGLSSFWPQLGVSYKINSSWKKHVKLKIIYNSSESHEELFTRSNEVPINQKHLRALATEICKSLADINPDFMEPYFTIKEMPYNLRNGCVLKWPYANSTYCGINSVLFRAC